MVGLFILLILGALWSVGVFKTLFAGPKIPLPRAEVNLTLGLTLDQVLEKYPLLNMGEVFKKYPKMTLEEIIKKHSAVRKNLAELKKTLRPFNNDPLFGITTLNAQTGLSDASSMDLLFFKGRLYFISAMWEGDNAKKVTVDDWVHQFRRWIKPSAGTESLGNDVSLKEWHFKDDATEMTLRDLNYNGKLQRWQDLRDGSNAEAQAAFQKYRLDGNN